MPITSDFSHWLLICDECGGRFKSTLAFPTPHECAECIIKSKEAAKESVFIFKSTVLTCYVDDDDCSTCKFISGDRDIKTLLDVIQTLDNRLNEEEVLRQDLIDTIANHDCNGHR